MISPAECFRVPRKHSRRTDVFTATVITVTRVFIQSRQLTRVPKLRTERISLLLSFLSTRYCSTSCNPALNSLTNGERENPTSVAKCLPSFSSSSSLCVSQQYEIVTISERCLMLKTSASILRCSRRSSGTTRPI